MSGKTRAQRGKKFLTFEADLGLEPAIHFSAPRSEQTAHSPESKIWVKKNVLFVDEPLQQPVILFDCSHIRVILQCNTANIFHQFQYVKHGLQGGTSKKNIFF
ncbi:MAG: hypothetical protein J6P69_07295 [Bacteroidales bacterium]|nr:hypothetical protein [Bacteroidales bacterium]